MTKQQLELSSGLVIAEDSAQDARFGLLSGVVGADLGAQYITRSSLVNEDVYQFLQQGQRPVFVPLAPSEILGMREDSVSKLHYTAPRGTVSIVGALLGEGRAGVRLQTELTELIADKNTGKITARGNSPAGIVEEQYDAVVLTTPSTIIRKIQGDLIQSLTLDQLQSADSNQHIDPSYQKDKLVDVLGDVSYSSR